MQKNLSSGINFSSRRPHGRYREGLQSFRILHTGNDALFFPWSAFPDTAVIGDTFAACFAGAFAAISTVISPTKIPQAMPKILIPKRGISENSSLTTKRSTAHSPHVVTTPKIRPMGTAVLHQFNASKRTKRMVCCLLIPMQRIIPKIWFSGQRYCSYCWKSSKRLQSKSAGTEQPQQKEGFAPWNCRASLQ